MLSSQKIETRADYESACVKFIDEFFKVDEPSTFVDAITDVSLQLYATDELVDPRQMGALHLLIIELRKLKPLYCFKKP